MFSVLVAFVAMSTLYCAPARGELSEGLRGGSAQTDSLSLQEVVVTGTRNAVDVRHLPYTVNVINRLALTDRKSVV